MELWYVTVLDVSSFSLKLTHVDFMIAKFLIDHEGKPFRRYDPKTPPLDLKGDIEELLKKKSEVSS
jgi:glutathione peroxidase-family protein